MPSFAQLPPDQRRRFCNEAQAKLGLHAVSVEKDFWVCWTLRELFQLPEWGAHFTFKGGTSLAKGWKLIERFSEDIDVVIERDFLGFGGDRGPEHAPSKKQQRVRLDALKAECQQRIQHSLQRIHTVNHARLRISVRCKFPISLGAVVWGHKSPA